MVGARDTDTGETAFQNASQHINCTTFLFRATYDKR